MIRPARGVVKGDPGSETSIVLSSIVLKQRPRTDDARDVSFSTTAGSRRPDGCAGGGGVGSDTSRPAARAGQGRTADGGRGKAKRGAPQPMQARDSRYAASEINRFSSCTSALTLWSATFRSSITSGDTFASQYSSFADSSGAILAPSRDAPANTPLLME